MKQKKEREPDVKAYRVVKRDKKEEYIETYIPANLAKDKQLLMVTETILAEEMDGSVEQIKVNKELYREFLLGATDSNFLRGLANQEKEQYKKDLIAQRITELEKPKEKEKTTKKEGEETK